MKQGMVYNIQRMSTEDGPGIRTTVFLKGCPLSCLWCSNPESQLVQPQLMVFGDLCSACGQCVNICPHGANAYKDEAIIWDTKLCQNCGLCVPQCPTKARVMSGSLMDSAEVMKIVLKDTLFYHNSGGGVTFGGGEPTANGEFLLELLSLSRNEGLHTCVDTCGFCPEDRFKQVLELTDMLLFDCKHMNPEKHKELTGVDNSQILGNLQLALQLALQSKIEVRIRIPMLPNLNDSEENIAAIAKFLQQYSHKEVDVLPYHAFGRNKYAALNLEYPSLQTYAPDTLNDIIALFAKHGLKANIA